MALATPHEGAATRKYSHDDLALLSDSIAPYDPERGRVPTNPNLGQELSRTMSQRVQNVELIYAELQKLTTPLPTMGGGRPYPPLLPDRGPYEVQFDGPDDPIHPFNWAFRRKIIICGALALSAFSVSMGSAMFSASLNQLMEHYHIGWTPATLGTTLFVFGFASGPVIWGPLSELFGRRIVLIISCFGYVCFNFATAVSKDIQSIMICRFFAGFIGAAPLVVAPAAFTDMYTSKYRGLAITVFVVTIFAGPMMAPILGAFTVKNHALGWRWTCYFTGIVGAFSLILVVVLFPETYAPIILKEKAETLRRRTKNWGIYAPHDEFTLTLKEICEKNITRPLVMLFTEPILFMVTLYNAFVYGILYMFLTAIPLIFQGLYHWRSGVAQLPYIAMLLGAFIGGAIGCAFEYHYGLEEEREGYLKPEKKLIPLIIGGFVFTAGIFWLGWGGAFGNKVHWIVPTIGAVPVGMGLILIFLPCFNYIIDCYLIYAASAIAGNTFLRSAFGAAFPLFTKQMFTNMKVKWALTLIGGLAAIMIPVPVFFYIYGDRFRLRSKYSVDMRELKKEMSGSADQDEADLAEAEVRNYPIKEELQEAEAENRPLT